MWPNPATFCRTSPFTKQLLRQCQHRSFVQDASCVRDATQWEPADQIGEDVVGAPGEAQGHRVEALPSQLQNWTPLELTSHFVDCPAKLQRNKITSWPEKQKMKDVPSGNWSELFQCYHDSEYSFLKVLLSLRSSQITHVMCQITKCSRKDATKPLGGTPASLLYQLQLTVAF